MRRWLLAVVLGLAAGLSQAQGYGPDYGTGERMAPGAALQQRVDALTGYLARHPHTGPAEIRAFLGEAVAPFFDFERMAYLVAGPLNRYMEPGQRERFVVGFRATFLDAVAQRLAGVQVGQVEYLAPRGNPADGNVVLGVRVSGTGYPVQLDFRLVEGPHGWRIVDVSANGVSALGYYRGRIAALARDHGVRGVLARLAD